MTDRPTDPLPLRLLGRVVDARPAELAPLGWAAAYYFLLLTAYYILRPIREEFGVSGGLDSLPWLMQATLVVTLLVNPAYSALVARLTRSRFIPLVYRGCIAALVVFYALLRTVPEEQLVWVGRTFYVFLSVFNLFVVSVFWSLLSDLFEKERAKRLFGIVAAGGTVGAMMGSGITALFIDSVGRPQLLLVSCLFLEGAVRAARGVMRHFTAAPASQAVPDETRLVARGDEALGGSMWAGMRLVVRSPYLLGLCSYAVLYGLASTFAYVIQAEVVASFAEGTAARTRVFANLDLYTNATTLLLQTFVAGRLLRRFGPGLTLLIHPAFAAVGFLILGSSWIPAGSMLLVLGGFQVMMRSLAYGVAKPAREVLFIVLSPEEKYKSKNLIDVAMHRTGDAVGSEVSKWVEAGGRGLGTLTSLASPMSVVWVGVCFALGVGFNRRGKATAGGGSTRDGSGD